MALPSPRRRKKRDRRTAATQYTRQRTLERTDCRANDQPKTTNQSTKPWKAPTTSHHESMDILRSMDIASAAAPAAVSLMSPQQQYMYVTAQDITPNWGTVKRSTNQPTHRPTGSKAQTKTYQLQHSSAQRSKKAHSSYGNKRQIYHTYMYRDQPRCSGRKYIVYRQLLFIYCPLLAINVCFTGSTWSTPALTLTALIVLWSATTCLP